jgi:ABC-2 type transport system ATP-binding protein
MSIVYTSHYMEEVEMLCKRVAIVDQGKIIALDTVENLVAILGGGVILVGLDKADEGLLKELTALPDVQLATIVQAPAAPPPAEGEEPKDIEATAAPTHTTVKVETENSRNALVNVITFMNQQDIPIRSLEILESNLENVFLHLTGKKLRE